MRMSLLAAAGVISSAVFLALLAPAPARADIYGFVDERGVTHFSDVPLDHRYYLFKKDRREATLPGSKLLIVNVPQIPLRRAAQISPARRKEFAPVVAAVARDYQLSPALLHAIIAVESGYDPRARSPKGAAGLMQLMPETARRYAVRDIWDPRQNVDGGARYLRDLLALFKNDLALALAAYNAGEAAVIQHGNRIPPYAETRNYVPRVMQHYHLYADAGR